jgi:hypothetical protein
MYMAGEHHATRHQQQLLGLMRAGKLPTASFWSESGN